jgi:hypothetical protein
MIKLIGAAAATVTLAAGLAARPALAEPAAAGKTVVLQHSRLARAKFVSSNGCVLTTVEVQLDDTALENVPGTTTHLRTATISVDQRYDASLGPSCAHENPVIQISSAEIVNPQMILDSNLELARLHGDAALDDETSGGKHNVKFDLRWSGRGGRQTTKTHDVRTEDNKVITTDDLVQIRHAQACGFLTETLPDGHRVNYTPRPSLTKSTDDTNLKREELRETTVTK